MRLLPIILACLFFNALNAQSDFMDSLIWLNYQYQHEQNKKFKDSLHSPLAAEDRESFESLNWYPVDTNFIVWATLERTPDTEVFELATTTERKPKYRQFGILHFQIADSSYAIPIYRNLRLKTIPKYKNHLFFPFTDLTNAFGTYGGGRYLDLEIPEGDSILIDFNRAYNPYCAYNARYSCPIPPQANHINLAIKAGVRYEVKH